MNGSCPLADPHTRVLETVGRIQRNSRGYPLQNVEWRQFVIDLNWMIELKEELGMREDVCTESMRTHVWVGDGGIFTRMH